MPRSKDNLRQEADREEKMSLAQIKLDAALLNVDEMAILYKEKVDNQIKLFQDITDKHLQMKLPNFLGRKLDNFTDYQGSVSGSSAAPRSRSVSRKREKIPNQQPTWTRVQSLDRERKDDAPTLSFLRLRWRAGDLEAVGPLCQRTDSQQQWLSP
ncbi:borealin-like [Drosophila kikkawai]|uniref:Borealin-like n=1 Tax=Drosophila kikkawai TaxID=30033 RepID=A0A6P4IRD7_DROKI|nr:borealin-like [Drosophila kikkawai]